MDPPVSAELMALVLRHHLPLGLKVIIRLVLQAHSMAGFKFWPFGPVEEIIQP